MRLALIGVSVVLTALAVAAAGPLLFVALIAGAAAHRLLGPSGTGGVLAAACLGAILLLAQVNRKGAQS